jgi:hypothetical protein
MSLPAIRHRIQLGKAGGDRLEPIEELCRLAQRLKYRLGVPVLADVHGSALISPVPLEPRGNEDWTILGQESLDLAERSRDRWLFQMCNFWWQRRFEQVMGRKWGHRAAQQYIDGNRIYSDKLKEVVGPLGPILIQSYLSFDFIRDRDNHLVIVLDFGNRYRSIATLDRLGPLNDLGLKPGQSLIHAYDGKRCEWIGEAPVTVGDALPELGNRSILTYHQEEGHLSAAAAAAIDPKTRAIAVRYGKKVFHHLPHLLHKVYDHSDLKKSMDLDGHLHAIGKKFDLARKTITRFNRWEHPPDDFLEFQTTPRPATDPQRLGTDNPTRTGNLDFGPDRNRPGQRILRGYPAAGVNNYFLLEKPDVINGAILVPEPWRGQLDNRYAKHLKELFRPYGIDLKLTPRNYDPADALSIRQACQDLPKACHLAIAAVPSKAHPLYNREIDPYKTLKQQLNSRHLPSQMVTETAFHNLRDFIDRNILLGILAKLGHRAWQIHEMPGEADAFVGLDIGRKDGQALGAAAFALGRQGEVLGWGQLTTREQGETFEPRSLHTLLFDLAAQHQQKLGRPLERLVIHRDGTVKNSEMDCLLDLEQQLGRAGLKGLDVVEIVKNNPCRAGKATQNSFQNPDAGWLWHHCPGEMLLLSTGDRDMKVVASKVTFKAPQPLKIRQRHGTTPLPILTAQIYWLSQVHGGTTQTVRLPVTLHYADRAATMALAGVLPPGLQTDSRLWFL